MGVPLEQHGVARRYKNPEKGLKANGVWACHMSNQAWHANEQQGKAKSWACHLVSKAWHASSRNLTKACHLNDQAWHASTEGGQTKLGVACQPLEPRQVKGMARQSQGVASQSQGVAHW
ncbi:uncharacterized protein DS421_3g86130 [Arachis hypogaea]|nr:uncharacterized protein DS421_3g86130 [Arachis hypogaea]